MPNSVVTKTIIKKSTGNISIMSFDSGEGLTEKTTPFDTFAQIIEGPAAAVAALQASIARDPRHADVQTILSGPHEARLFDDWSLAYAGPSIFVSGEVDAAFEGATRSAERLVAMLREFASPS